MRETPALCGNGEIEAEEQCDDGNTLDDDACSGSCRGAFCGDGIVRTDLGAEDVGFEACDDGNDINDDA